MSLLPILLRGLRCRCPRCGEGRLFASYVRPHAACAVCGLELSGFRADDAPPYFTIFAVGHIVVPAMLWVEKGFHPEAWVHLALWVPLTLILSLALLPPIKGAVIGALWRLKPGDPEQAVPSPSSTGASGDGA